ncbi:SDR family oxidoreductase [Marinibactrum halimedae]|uniref:Short-chain dehydrogenase/reductase n=1 Tax=Marinibactrum halimedae TaxID=1444977 RepID=A0AA37WQ00_9GAMM|nr:SDR family oxidoreductase [Marinibactrum halimedae]MCD9459043.1 SDR family oxidoreductase [Marinibactrum halimedae]GLS26827.1 short-chain dehydrogenase/reductase [Marinibactrum halimedae]
MTKKTVLITGCSSGFGALAVKTFQQNGWNVVATMRTPEKDTTLGELENVLLCRLDVTDEQSIDAAVEKALAEFGSIDALVNNAGYGGHAVFEQFEMSQIQAMFETNVYGPMRVAARVLPHMRKQGSGVVVNVTSMAAEVGLPFASTYSASKFAAQGWSEGLALEYAPFNIKVKTVAPGAYGTNFSAATDNNFTAGDEQLTTYAGQLAAHFEGLAAQMRQQGGKEADPQEVADKIYQCVTSETPIHNAVGADATMLMDMKNSQSREAFLEQMSAMLVPNR